MIGYYVYVTQDGITHLRWKREPNTATDLALHWHREYGVEPFVRGPDLNIVGKAN